MNGAGQFSDGNFVGWVDCRDDGYYGGDFDVEDKGQRSADPCSARSCKRMDGKRRGHCGRVANRDTWIGVSFLDRVYCDDGFLSGQPENWISVEQCLCGGRVVWRGGVWIHVLGGCAALECQTVGVFVGSDNHGDRHAYRVRWIADCVERKEVFELGHISEI